MAPDLRLLSRTLVARAVLERHDRWDRRTLRDHQARALARLRSHALAASPYYRRTRAGLENAPLSELPVLTKDELMANWDDVCTDKSLRLADAEGRLLQAERSMLDPGRPWRGRWWVAATGGTTGRRAVLAWNRIEWAQVLASYARVNDWAGVGVDLRNPVRTAIVSSLNPTHQSAVVGASINSRLVPTLRLDARTPVKSLVSALNDFQPRLLVSYASMLGTLAGAQLAGDLHLSPAKVIAASEVLPADGRAAAQRAWGRDVVVDTYAATETAGIASTCEQGRWHLYEDLVIVEAVDDDCQAVPVGASGTRLLVTPLFTRTFPLIRYELTDAVRLEPGSCPCGRPFALLGAVEGRTEDTLTLPGAAGGVRVHPAVFHTALESLSPDGWQVAQTDTGLVVRLAGRATQDHLARARILHALTELGVTGLQVDVRLVPSIERTPLGKAPLVKAPPAS